MRYLSAQLDVCLDSFLLRALIDFVLLRSGDQERVARTFTRRERLPDRDQRDRQDHLQGLRHFIPQKARLATYSSSERGPGRDSTQRDLAG